MQASILSGGKDLIFPKVLGVVAAIVVIGNGLLLAAFLGLQIETQIHALVTRDERNVISFLHQADITVTVIPLNIKITTSSIPQLRSCF
jgi:hypothetical protein